VLLFLGGKMKRLSVPAVLIAAALTLCSAPVGPVRFESKPRAVGAGNFPQIAVRVTGDLSLLSVEGGDLWYLSSPDTPNPSLSARSFIIKNYKK
jgi:hypothetical protein